MGKQKYWAILMILILVGLITIPIWLTKRKMKVKPPVEKSTIIRQPAVAGSFYSADAGELDKEISSLINQSERISAEGKLRVLIVPHAGTVFSGPTAAAGFKQIEGQDYKRVIILGVSHRAWFDHVAIFNQGEWETPLGKVEVDEDLSSVIIDKDTKIIADMAVHNEEHSLEIELIFLQKVLKNFKIVPILLSQTNDELINTLAQKIAQNLDDQTLLVVSSDLSHYPPWKTAKEVDGKTIEAILSGKPEEFSQTIVKLESAGYPGVETAACGHDAIRVGLKVAEILGINFKKIKYENSGDVSGDKTRVVGYAAIGGFGGKMASAAEQLDKKSQQEALEIARKTLEEYLINRKAPSITSPSQILNQPLGCFVTLRNNKELRGCIGEFEPKEPLAKVIQKMAIAAATQDPRFPPVTADELKEIKIEISVMSPKRKISNWQEIELGKHGVVVQKGMQAGTFLPQVATETGWSLEEFLAQLCTQKAGLPPDCYKDPTVTLYTFEAQVFEEE